MREGESESEIEREIACARGDLRKRVGVRGHLRVEYSSVNEMDAPVCVCVTLYRNVCLQTLACRLLARVRYSEKRREPAHPTKLEVLYWALREIAREKKRIHTQETERQTQRKRVGERRREREKKVSERERERERERGRERVGERVCVCERERERERKKEQERESERDRERQRERE